MHVVPFLQQHSYLAGLGTLWIFSAFVGGMPAPDANAGRGYLWLYGSLHMLAANLDKVVQAKNLKQP